MSAPRPRAGSRTPGSRRAGPGSSAEPTRERRAPRRARHASASCARGVARPGRAAGETRTASGHEPAVRRPGDHAGAGTEPGRAFPSSTMATLAVESGSPNAEARSIQPTGLRGRREAISAPTLAKVTIPSSERDRRRDLLVRRWIAAVATESATPIASRERERDQRPGDPAGGARSSRPALAQPQRDVRRLHRLARRRLELARSASRSTSLAQPRAEGLERALRRRSGAGRSAGRRAAARASAAAGTAPRRRASRRRSRDSSRPRTTRTPPGPRARARRRRRRARPSATP